MVTVSGSAFTFFFLDHRAVRPSFQDSPVQPVMSQQRVRDYIRGWTAYHSGPDADVDALTKRVFERIRPHPDHSLDRINRKELELALGTKDADDARTLVDITNAVLSNHLDEPCSHETAHAVAETILNVYETGWDLAPTMRLPSALDTAHEALLRRDLTQETAKRLVEAHASQSGTELSGER